MLTFEELLLHLLHIFVLYLLELLWLPMSVCCLCREQKDMFYSKTSWISQQQTYIRNHSLLVRILLCSSFAAISCISYQSTVFGHVNFSLFQVVMLPIHNLDIRNVVILVLFLRHDGIIYWVTTSCIPGLRRSVKHDVSQCSFVNHSVCTRCAISFSHITGDVSLLFHSSARSRCILSLRVCGS